MSPVAKSLLVVLLLSAAPHLVANPVDIPCSECPDFNLPPVPESGIWSDPLRPGTGYTLNLQRRTTAGAYFGYAPDGRAIWYVFSGPLLPATAGADYAWSLEATATEYRGGGCIDCPHAPPQAGTARFEMRFEFLQRSLARVRVDDGPWALIRPQTWGVATSPEFAPSTSFPVPELAGPWVLVFQNLQDFPLEISRIAYVAESTGDVSGPDDARITMGFFPNDTPLGFLDCTRSSDGTPTCRFSALYTRNGPAPSSNGKEFILPLGNISASRFKGEAADGETVEGFRIDHD
jgi:hypothetical protein